jgi:CRP-like cAMP-binding protein
MMQAMPNSASYVALSGERFSIASARTTDRVANPNRLAEARSVLGCLPERELHSLRQQSMIRVVRERQHVFKCGDPGRTVIVVLDGYVKLSVTTTGGQEVIVEIVPPGVCFGELAVLNNCPRGADAVTISRCKLLTIDARDFLRVMERCPEGLLAMVQLISGRLRAVTQRVLDAKALSPSSRVAKLLMHLAELQSPVVGDGTKIALRLSQAELGAMIGLTRESMNKHLAAMRDAGWIALSARSVTLLNTLALHDVSRDVNG